MFGLKKLRGCGSKVTRERRFAVIAAHCERSCDHGAVAEMDLHQNSPSATTIPFGIAAAGMESRIVIKLDAIFQDFFSLIERGFGPWLGGPREVKLGQVAPKGRPVNGLFNG